MVRLTAIILSFGILTGALNSVPAQANPNEEGLTQLTAILPQLSSYEISLFQFIDVLERLGQFLTVVQEAEEFWLVRTSNPPVGTRYLHAQFMGSKYKGFLQHFSFQFRPGDDAFELAVEAVKKAFGNLPAPRIQENDFISWRVNRAYNVWIKKLTWEDLVDHPYNAHTQEDVGAIQVAVELEVHR